MATFIDIAQSAIITGMILLILIGTQVGILESSVENRMLQELQGITDVTLKVIHKDVKRLAAFNELTDSSISFVTISGENVSFERIGEKLRIQRQMPGSEPVIREENLHLNSLQFEPVSLPGASHALLRIRVTSELEMKGREGEGSIIAIAQRDVLLRNLYLPQAQ